MNYSGDLQTLEIETFSVESLDGLGVNAALCDGNIAMRGVHPDLSICTTSSTTSSSCG